MLELRTRPNMPKRIGEDLRLECFFLSLDLWSLYLVCLIVMHFYSRKQSKRLKPTDAKAAKARAARLETPEDEEKILYGIQFCEDSGFYIVLGIINPFGLLRFLQGSSKARKTQWRANERWKNLSMPMEEK